MSCNNDTDEAKMMRDENNHEGTPNNCDTPATQPIDMGEQQQNESESKEMQDEQEIKETEPMQEDELSKEVMQEEAKQEQQAPEPSAPSIEIDYRSYTDFFSRSPVTPKELNETEKHIQKNMEDMLSKLEHGKEKAYRDLLNEMNRISNFKKKSQQKPTDKSKSDQEALQEAVIQGSPRDYQTALVQIATERNTIINLGTGKGKTLIALLCIRHFSAAFQKGKQTLFLVPSVPLAIQQTTTLKANLPYTVEMASFGASHSKLGRQKIAEANIVVGTHGAIHDLLQHYGDLFQMDRFNFIVFDECHHAFGNHQYKAIMMKWYHPLPPERRPRILGLTASPLINLKMNLSDDALHAMLRTLEEVLDAKMATLKSIGYDTSLLHKPAEEKHVFYHGNDLPSGFPSHNDRGLHDSRIREFNQLNELYKDLGPLVVALYCRVLIRDISCNNYESETNEQFRLVMAHLERIRLFCQQEVEACHRGGRTEKLLKLEQILEEQIEFGKGGQETVGLIFVDRRITASALFEFFGYRQSQLDKGKWTRVTVGGQIPEEDSLPILSKPKEKENGQEEEEKKERDEIQESLLLDEVPWPPEPEEGQFHDPDNDLSPVLIRGPDRKKPKHGNEGTSKDNHLLFGGLHDFGQEHLVDVCETPTNTNIVEGQFDDDSTDSWRPMDAIPPPPVIEPRDTIRCCVLVRQATQIFKYMNKQQQQYDKADQDATIDENSDDLLDQPSFHQQEARIHEIMNALKRREKNLLLATSVVEEGVDVQACSFVVMFDKLRSTKAYVQCKGRARKENAKFYAFQDKNGWKASALEAAQRAERRLHSFISAMETMSHQSILGNLPIAAKTSLSHPSLEAMSTEIRAIEEGCYRTSYGLVDLKSAKSVLNNYVLKMPIDAATRSSREAFALHLPTFTDYELILPSHLPSKVRLVSLPDQYKDLDKSKRHQILALLACVRLHDLKLLNERLLPLSRRDLCKTLLHVTESIVPKVETKTTSVKEMFEIPQRQFFIYPILQSGMGFASFKVALKGTHHTLALVCAEKLDVTIESRTYHHPEMGDIHISTDTPKVETLSEDDWDVISEFHCALTNARWKRKSRNEWYRVRNKQDAQHVLQPYGVGYVSLGDGKLDMNLMKSVVSAGQREAETRASAPQSYPVNEQMKEPKLCHPFYMPNTIYILHGASTLDCSCAFPDEKEGIKTFRDYFSVRWNVKVSARCPLFVAQRLWYLPVQGLMGEGKKEFYPWIHGNHAGIEGETFGYDLCPELDTVLLPTEVCRENAMPNPFLALQLVVLPQFLHYIDQHLVARNLVIYCERNLPLLGKCLRDVPNLLVREAITAKSAAMDVSYDRLEWLGDGVLKLLQTDALLNIPALEGWVRYLHEGDLTTLRAVLVNNQYLAKLCRDLGLDEYIINIPLARGEFIPVNLENFTTDPDDDVVRPYEAKNPMKVCADMIEALLGLLYIHYGYEMVCRVAVEIGLSPAKSVGGSPEITETAQGIVPRRELLELAMKLTGKSSFKVPGLVEEAFTHSSSIYEEVSSYQRLEWIGDAALCVASREWIYHTFPDSDVGQLAALDAALVSNEVLAYQCVKLGLHHYINHRDQSLPSKIENYEWTIGELGRGMWGSDPSKILSDVVEALFGAVHVDGGFHDGQRAVRRLLDPIFEGIKGLDGNLSKIQHPLSVMKETSSPLLCCTIMREDELVRMSGGGKKELWVWQGSQWRKAEADGTSTIGIVTCLGKDMVYIAEQSPKTAQNRACALVAGFLERHPNFSARWRSVTALVERIDQNVKLHRQENQENNNTMMEVEEEGQD